MQQLRRILKLVSFGIVCGFAAGCDYYESKVQPPSQEELGMRKTADDFDSIRRLVFEARCIRCHQQYANYDSVYRERLNIRNAVVSGRMPKSGSPLSSDELNKTVAWIDAGAPRQATTPLPSTSEALRPEWSSISIGLIFPKCLVCHSPQGQAKFLDLSSRQIIFENRNRMFGGEKKLVDFDRPGSSYILDVVDDPDEPMPPLWSSISRLTVDERSVLEEWITRGLP